tara:strand:- start:124 stop:555 length:432 start_codon:yes stop_codon:yes gene_type:complete
MSKKINIKTVIRKIVREEVAMVIDEVISELKKPQQQVQRVSKPIKTENIEQKQYSTNPILNEVLNETEGGISDEEYPTMGGGVYDSGRMNDILKSSYNTGDPTDEIATSFGIKPDQAPNFLKKDYRKLMKAVDKKKNGGPLKG